MCIRDSTYAILKSANTGLMKVSFPANDLNAALKNALDQFDYCISLNNPYIHQHSEEFFHHYVLIMTLLSTSEVNVNKDESVSEDNILSHIHADRESIIELWKDNMSHVDYINFYNHLKNYYTHKDYTTKIEAVSYTHLTLPTNREV